MQKWFNFYSIMGLSKYFIVLNVLLNTFADIFCIGFGTLPINCKHKLAYSLPELLSESIDVANGPK